MRSDPETLARDGEVRFFMVQSKFGDGNGAVDVYEMYINCERNVSMSRSCQSSVEKLVIRCSLNETEEGLNPVAVETPDFQHSIKVAAKRTGLSPHVIRAWERRYATVRPGRSGGNRRLYSQADIERLSLLREATVAGHPIGDVAGLPTERLRELVVHERSAGARPGGGMEAPGPAVGGGASGRLAAAFDAVVGMDSTALEGVLEAGLVEFGQVRLLNELIAPLVEKIGEEWRAGRLKVAHEHVATSALRTFLGQVSRPIALHPSAPVLLVTTPAGQLHELGAALAAAAAAGHGWRVIYAGAAMPAEEIATAARASGSRAVALSIVHPADDPAMDTELRRLRRLLPPPVAILVGGRVSAAYATTLRDIGASVVGSLDEFTRMLDRLTVRPVPPRRAGGAE